MQIRKMVLAGAESLKAAGVPDPEHDARALLLFAAGMTLSDYAALRERELPKEQEELYASLLLRRQKREPLQYITGAAPFFGREFRVCRDVLIPRFDTETLIEAVLPALRSGMRILDLCTGSGCILLTLLLEGPEGMEGTGSDVSEAALRCAAENARLLKAEAHFLKSDLFGKIEGRFDLITANPPYIRSGDIPALDEEVNGHEPRLALDGGPDGLDFYRRICGEAPSHLKAGGCLAFEIGAEEARDVCALLAQNGFSRIEVRQDLSGRDRAVLGVLEYVGEI